MEKIFSDTTRYQKIMNFEYNGPKRHLHMSLSERAVQFAPFAALSGYSDMLKASTREVIRPISLANEALIELNQQLQDLKTVIATHPLIEIKYYDQHLQNYLSQKDHVIALDELSQRLKLEKNGWINFSNILQLLRKA